MMKSLQYKYFNKNFFAGVFGNILEWYDFAVFGFLTPIISQLFFPKEDHLVAILMTYGVFATGYLMRPLGGIIFGYIGDKQGRKVALQISMLMMAVPTVLIGFIPTYGEIGLYATILLIILRMLQGLSVGGELMGSISYLVEIAPPNKKNFYGSFTLFSAVGGLLLGSSIVTVLDFTLGEEVMNAWGWRIPFVGGLFIFLFGLWLRKEMEESPDFLSKKVQSKPFYKSPFHEVMSTMLKRVIRLFAVISVATVSSYTLMVWMPTYMGDIINPPIKDALLITTLSMIVVVVFLPISGYISDIYGGVKVFKISCISLAILAYPLFLMINQHDFWMAMSAQFIFAIIVGFIQGPLPAIMATMFPTNLRYTGMGLGYNTATAILGGTTPMVATLLIETSGSLVMPSFYLIVFAILSFLAV